MTYIIKTKWLFMGFLFGGAIGSAIALLYAPESGKHLRRDISRKTNELIEAGKEKTIGTWKDAKEIAENTIESANDFLDANVKKIVRKAENLKEAFNSGIDAYNEEMKSEENQSKSYIEEEKNTHRRRR